jgi:2-desacetyl-2-hydroxyethyl bacteriochlorophyllide A dehydrogenase
MPARIVFAGKREAGLEEFSLREPDAGEVLVRTRWTMLSTGTESIVYNRDFDPGTHFDAWVRYPFRPGYLAVGTVEDGDAFGHGTAVFLRGSHASHHVVDAARCTPLPASIDPRDALWCGLAKIAFSGVRAAGYKVGEDVVIVGAGPIGQMSVRWASAAGLHRIVVADVAPFRLELARRGGATHTIERPIAEAAGEIREILGADGPRLVIDTTGNSPVLTECLHVAAPFGRVVLLGDTGRPAEQRLSPDVIVKGLEIAGVHDSHNRDGWDEPRVNRMWLSLVERRKFPLDRLMTHELDPAADPAAPWELARERRQETMGICLNWEGFD